MAPTDNLSLFGEEEAPRRVRLTYSGIRLFEECPWAYHRSTTQGVAQKRLRYYILLGNMLHGVLGELTNLPASERTTDRAIELVHRRWPKWPDAEAENEDAWKLRSEQMVRSFVDRGGASGNIAARETPFEIARSAYSIQGRIDRIDRLDDTTFKIVEYKFGDENPPELDEVIGDHQWVIYWLGAERLMRPFGLRPEAFVFHFLNAESTIEFSPNAEMLQSAIARLEDAAASIIDAVEYPARRNYQCASCFFDIVCPLRRGPGSTRSR